MADTLPTPTTLYVYDDLPYFASPTGAQRWPALIDALLRLLRAQPQVRFLTVAALVEALAASGLAAGFEQALAIGGSGRRVAELLQARTGWFAAIETAPLSRQERADGGHTVIAGNAHDLDVLLAATADRRVAIVDDTLYSGLTVRWLLDRLPASARPTVLCLQAVQTTLRELSARCPVVAGVQLAGVPELDFSVIKASHLFEPGAIRTPTTELAFYERRAWLDAWFPAAAETIAAVCAELRALLPVVPE